MTRSPNDPLPDASALNAYLQGGAPPTRSSGLFDMGSGGWQNILAGLALLDASRARVNPPPLMQTLAPIMAANAQREQQQKMLDVGAQVFGGANAPKFSDLFGAGTDAAPGMGAAPGAGGSPGGSPGAAPMGPNPFFSPATTGGNLSGQGIATLAGLDQQTQQMLAQGRRPPGYPDTGSDQLLAGGAISNPGGLTGLIQSAAARSNVPAPMLANLLGTESNFDPNAVSPRGAAGPAGLMPGTAADLGVTNSRDFGQAVPAAAQYLRDNTDHFGGNVGIGLAAYNWGPGNVSKWIQGGADPAAVPAETRDYVQKVSGKPLDEWINGGGTAARNGDLPPGVRVNSQGMPFSDTLLNMSPQERANNAASMAALRAGMNGQPVQAGGTPVQMAQATPQTMNDGTQPPPAATSRDVSQARNLLQTAPPRAPDTVSGTTSQQAAAQKYVQYYLNVMDKFAPFGEAGKPIVDAAKTHVEFAKEFLSADYKKQLDLQYDPIIAGRTETQKRFAGLPFVGPEAQAKAGGEHAGALPYLPAEERIKADEAIRQALAGQGLARDGTGNIVRIPGWRENNAENKGVEAGAVANAQLPAKVGETTAGNYSKLGAEELFKRRTSAQDAAESLRQSQEARTLIGDGINTGPFAQWKQSFDRVLGDNHVAANTEAFVAARATEVGRLIKQFGSGTGLSDADREYAAQMAAGKIGLTKESIVKILDMNDRAARTLLDRYNQDAAQVPSGLVPYPMTVKPSPGAAAASIVTPYGTIRQVR